jgi:tetratricopeptide (TPR) repeat protein
MNKVLVKIFLVAVMFYSYTTSAQSKVGLQYMSDERWWSAEKEFSKSTADEDVFYKGYCEMKMEEVEKAKSTFNSIATKPYGKIGLGWLELNTGNKDGATALFDAAAKETKNKNADIFIAISRAIASSTATTKDAATEWAKRAVDMNKMNADYRIAWGESYASILDGGNAITQYEYAAQYAPVAALPFAKIGQIYYRSRNYKDALENLNKAIVKDPNNLFALNYLAQIYFKYKKFDTAKMYQSRILELGDKSPEDMAFMANIIFEEKDYEGSIKIISDIIKGNNKYNYLNRLIGYSYYETQKPAEAKDFLEKFLNTQPKDKLIAKDYDYLGKAYIDLGDTAKGLETMVKALEFNPTDKEAIKNLADYFKKIKRYEEALVWYKKLTELPEATSDDFFQLAGMYYTKKDYTSAEAAYTKVLEMSPNSSGTYYQRAGVRMMLDPTQATSSAKPDYEKFIELTVGKEEKFKKQIIKAKIYMAKDALIKTMDMVKAKQYIDELEILDPTNTELPDLKSNLK